MGNKHSGSAEFQAAAQKFSSAELRDMRMKFKSLAERSKGNTVDKASFLRYFPLPGQLGERLFYVFDKKSTGVIDYEEFVCGLALLSHGNRADKLQMLFDIYDMTGDGSIHKFELRTMLANVPEQVVITLTEMVTRMVDIAFETCDLNKDGKLSFEQFSMWIEQNLDLMEWLDAEALQNVPTWQGTTGNSTPKSLSDSMDSVELKQRSQSVIFANYTTTRMYSMSIDANEKKNVAEKTLLRNFSETSHEGWLYKQGGNFKVWVKRWYRIVGNFCYYFHREADDVPAGVFFMDGCIVEALSEGGKGAFGIELVFSTGGERDKRVLYASNEEERRIWVDSLRAAGNTRKFETDFDMHESIGEGKFSRVFRCTEKESGTDFAVKVSFKSNMSMVEQGMMQSEIAVLKQATHPSIVKLEAVFETMDKVMLVMELVHGGEMFNHIVGRPRLNGSEAKKVAMQLAEALRYLHSMGIIHRDVKPENILCDSAFDNLKLADFGLSRLVSPNELLYHPCGTPLYVAPEVLTGKGYSTPADMWSLGVILFLVIRGRLPYDFKRREDAVSTIESKELKFNDRVWSKVDEDCRNAVQALLCKDQAHRISAGDFLRHNWMYPTTCK
eukprot:g3073.t1